MSVKSGFARYSMVRLMIINSWPFHSKDTRKAAAMLLSGLAWGGFGPDKLLV
ncbi:hypothetical protein [Pseudomonas sp. 22 E 5]|nr:hypothetical protein [Pseudomonas sp. 22 E 5]